MKRISRAEEGRSGVIINDGRNQRCYHRHKVDPALD